MTSVSAARSQSPVRLVENHRVTHRVPNQTFHVITRDNDGKTYLDDEHTGTFAGVIRHAMVCARSIRARFDLQEVACDVWDETGKLVYSVSAVAGRGIRVFRLSGGE